jgi:hypothetical protein
VNLKPDAIMVGGSRALIALQQTTPRNPIVFVAARWHDRARHRNECCATDRDLTAFTTFDDLSLAGNPAFCNMSNFEHIVAL